MTVPAEVTWTVIATAGAFYALGRFHASVLAMRAAERSRRALAYLERTARDSGTVKWG
jgi:hypothetical protein